MREFDLRCMQEIAPQLELFRLPVPARRTGWGGLGGLLIGEMACAAIKRVPDDGVADGRHMHANLVGTARFNSYLEESEWAETGLQTAQNLKV